MALTERLRIMIDADGGGAVREVGKVGSAVDGLDAKNSKLSDGMKKWGPAMKAGGALAAAGIVPVGVELFKLGADLEQMEAKSKTVFGNQLGVVKKWADENANAMGLTGREATNLATSLADLLKPMGYNTEEAARMSTEVVGLSGALSAWTGGQQSAAEVSDILTKAMLGERDGLTALGIKISEEDVKAQRAIMEQGGQLKGMTEAQKDTAATIELIFQKSTDAQKAAADGTKSTNEKLEEQKARLREVREEMATRFVPALEWTMSKLGSYADATFNASEKTKGLQGAMFDLGQVVGDFFSDLAEDGAQTGSSSGSKIAVGNLLRKIFGMDPIEGSRAGGGPVMAGGRYLVGERGPELLEMGARSGSIIPNDHLTLADRGGSRSAATITNNIYMPPGSDGDDVVAALARWQRRNGPLPVATRG